MPKMKTYAVELDGRHVLMVAATSKKAAAVLLGTTTYMMTNWEGGINEDDEAVALAELGAVFSKPVMGGEWQKLSDPKAAACRTNESTSSEQRFKPRNPFTLPELSEHKTIFPDMLVKDACNLAALYTAARECADAKAAERIDMDIGAFLSEEFATRDTQAIFRARFMTLHADCNAAFGSLDHAHCRWAYDTAIKI